MGKKSIEKNLSWLVIIFKEKSKTWWNRLKQW